MNQLGTVRSSVAPVIILLLPLGLWGMLWFGISPGDANNVFQPKSPASFVHGVRFFLPFAAAILSAVVVAFKLQHHRPSGVLFFGPLGLTAVYGVVGLIASSQSPDGSLALRWAMLYVSVPIVLWAIVWGTDPLSHLQRIISITGMAVVLASLMLFAVALLYLDFWEALNDPFTLLECESGGWHDLTSGRLRETGVGRYAAIAGIIAISGLWGRNQRFVWAGVLACSVLLLLDTGARGAFGGFAIGAPLVVLLHGGKKVLPAGLITLLIVLLALWSTGGLGTLINQCILRGGVPFTEKQSPAQPESNIPALIQPQSEEEVNPATPKSTNPQPMLPAIPNSPAEEEVNPATPEPPNPQSTLPAIPNSPAQESAAVYSAPTPNVEFFKFTGRTSVWAEGLELFKESPFIGYGFHADRLILGTHLHNSFMQVLVQTGVIGTIPFLLAVIFSWILLIRNLRRLNQLPLAHKNLIIQVAGILAFFTVRSFPESTGAFFGIDWLILAPILLYLQTVNSLHDKTVKMIQLRAPNSI